MPRARKLFCKSIFGDTQKTLEAIQRFIDQDSKIKNNSELKKETEQENPSGSVNRVVNSVLNENIAHEIDKIIKDL